MIDINEVLLVGTIDGSPQLAETGSGIGKCTFSLVTVERFTRKDGREGSRAERHRIVVLGKRATWAAENIAASALVMVRGRISASEITDRDGVVHPTAEIIVAGLTAAMTILDYARAHPQEETA